MKSMQSAKLSRLISAVKNEGRLVDEVDGVQLKVEGFVPTNISWAESQELIRKAGEEVAFAGEYMSRVAAKQPDGIFDVEIDDGIVRFQYVDNDEFFVVGVEGNEVIAV